MRENHDQPTDDEYRNGFLIACLMATALLAMFVAIMLIGAPAGADERNATLPTAEELQVTVTELEAEVAELTAETEMRHEQVLALERKNDRFRRIIRRRTEALREEQAEIEADVREEWILGYTLGKGPDIAPFLGGHRGGINECESGWDPDANNEGLNANSSIDFGISQVNDRVWADTFVELTGEPFIPGIYDPMLNGFMAAEIHNRQGLDAWTSHKFKGCGK